MERELDIACAAYKKYETVKSDASFIYSEHFIEGAQWADEHPKSPWIKCDDGLPQDGNQCIILEKWCIEGNESFPVAEIVRYDADSKRFTYWDYTSDTIGYYPIDDIEAWMPIPKFNKE